MTLKKVTLLMITSHCIQYTTLSSIAQCIIISRIYESQFVLFRNVQIKLNQTLTNQINKQTMTKLFGFEKSLSKVLTHCFVYLGGLNSDDKIFNR